MGSGVGSGGDCAGGNNPKSLTALRRIAGGLGGDLGGHLAGCEYPKSHVALRRGVGRLAGHVLNMCYLRQHTEGGDCRGVYCGKASE